MSADGCHWPLSGAWSRFGSDGKALGKAHAQSGKYFNIFETNFMKIFSTRNAEKKSRIINNWTKNRSFSIIFLPVW